ncbi:MAG: triose-phosphate isomerase [Flavobacteriales bacterium]|nr:MAG: triose-phosphate isomerase [Bacteroidota bacterium]KXK33734.1 MAG: triosephosphate isomerase [Chlorobi bacterium OLB6]MBE2266100.1 triose-phosphate isomerase [Flavobacteriales bacterium]MBV6463282.1 Triosephosphate isomerase [Chlorobiota bacterium]MBW7853023.1 triose-phosphate isomerase [Candidatus Kapabacteria bacterium]
MKKTYVIGNWKMTASGSEGINLARLLRSGSSSEALDLLGDDNIEYDNRDLVPIVICPPFPVLSEVARLFHGTRFYVGAQDCHYHDKGAFTGDVSPAMLAELGCTWVIVGHSERRRYHSETNQVIGKKAAAALRNGLTPIVCIGENQDERRQGRTEAVLIEQIDGIVSELGPESLQKCVIAYEPVWAIGTGNAATSDQATSVHSTVKQHCLIICGKQLPVLYGGSVTSDNARDFISMADIDGVLVGGASLSSDFLSIAIAAGAR